MKCAKCKYHLNPNEGHEYKGYEGFLCDDCYDEVCDAEEDEE